MFKCTIQWFGYTPRVAQSLAKSNFGTIFFSPKEAPYLLAVNPPPCPQPYTTAFFIKKNFFIDFPILEILFNKFIQYVVICLTQVI